MPVDDGARASCKEKPVAIETPEQHEALIRALMDTARWPQGGGDRRRIDTHISSVILAGNLAYKIKKPLDLGFLDFVSLQAREQACREELRLNRRLAPTSTWMRCRSPVPSMRLGSTVEVR